MSLRKDQKPVGKKVEEKKKKYRKSHAHKTIVSRTLQVRCECVEKELREFDNDELEMEHLRELCLCNKQSCGRKKDHRFAGKTKKMTDYRLLAIIPATIKVA